LSDGHLVIGIASTVTQSQQDPRSTIGGACHLFIGSKLIAVAETLEIFGAHEEPSSPFNQNAVERTKVTAQICDKRGHHLTVPRLTRLSASGIAASAFRPRWRKIYEPPFLPCQLIGAALVHNSA
jgi:hypothetical protein